MTCDNENLVERWGLLAGVCTLRSAVLIHVVDIVQRWYGGDGARQSP